MKIFQTSRYCQLKEKYGVFLHFFIKTFGGKQKNIYLCIRFWELTLLQNSHKVRKGREKKEFFEKITINREVVVQEAGFFSTLYYIGVMDKEVLGRTKPIIFWRWYRMNFGGILNRDNFFPFLRDKDNVKKLYNSWNSERSKSLLLFPSRDKNV